MAYGPKVDHWSLTIVICCHLGVIRYMIRSVKSHAGTSVESLLLGKMADLMVMKFFFCQIQDKQWTKPFAVFVAGIRNNPVSAKGKFSKPEWQPVVMFRCCQSSQCDTVLQLASARAKCNQGLMADGHSAGRLVSTVSMLWWILFGQHWGRALGTLWCPFVCRLFVMHILWLNDTSYRKTVWTSQYGCPAVTLRSL